MIVNRKPEYLGSDTSPVRSENPNMNPKHHSKPKMQHRQYMIGIYISPFQVERKRGGISTPFPNSLTWPYLVDA